MLCGTQYKHLLSLSAHQTHFLKIENTVCAKLLLNMKVFLFLHQNAVYGLFKAIFQFRVTIVAMIISKDDPRCFKKIHKNKTAGGHFIFITDVMWF